MKNADMPIMPTNEYVEDCGPDGSQGPHLLELTHGGLTKREHFAALAMQGLLGQGGYRRPAVIAEDAVSAADALLAELERTP